MTTRTYCSNLSLTNIIKSIQKTGCTFCKRGRLSRFVEIRVDDELLPAAPSATDEETVRVILLKMFKLIIIINLI